MNPLIQIKKRIPLAVVTLLMTCFGLMPLTQAVIPPPDGGYPGFTTAEGQNALQNLTTGAANTALGWFSLFSDTEGSFNTAVGAGTLVLNTSHQNTATGAAALLLNTTGDANTANGALALLNNSTGRFNTAVGRSALENNTTGNDNTAVGNNALLNNTAGNFNTAVGDLALLNNTGNENTATGSRALLFNTTGVDNTATGSRALESNTTGDSNTADGRMALSSNTTGEFNTAIGVQALFSNTSGSSNVAVGLFAGGNVTTANNVICIGTGVLGADVSNSCYIGNIFGQTSAGGIAVFINSDGKLGTNTSSKRFKDEIKPMGKASEAILALKPVSFRYRKEIDPQGIPHFGLVAEEVHKVNPDLVVRDQQGNPHTVRYEQINAMLLNEFLKEHEKVQEQQSTIADLKLRVARQEKQIAALASGLQRVSAQIQMSKSAPQVVTNNH